MIGLSDGRAPPDFWQPFALGPEIVVDPVRAKISRDGNETAVEPRVMEVLVYLAKRAGKPVSKGELIDRVWRAHVVDEAVHRAVSLLRGALGDQAKQSRIVETIPRHGYRLMVEPTDVAARTGRRPARTAGYLAAATVSVILAALVWFELPQRTPQPAPIASASERAAPQPQAHAIGTRAPDTSSTQSVAGRIIVSKPDVSVVMVAPKAPSAPAVADRRVQSPEASNEQLAPLAPATAPHADFPMGQRAPAPQSPTPAARVANR